ncbi:MAG: hypothetical protein ACI30N_06985 [Muribaculaceae bacterium]
MSNEPREFETRERRHRRANPWLVAGVVILIALLMFWLSWAFFLGDTDVNGCIAPVLNLLTF